MELPEGITGFDSPGTVGFGEVAYFTKQFWRYELLELVDDQQCGLVRNFYQITVRYRRQHLVLLFNSSYRYVGIATHEDPNERHHFIDHRELSDILHEQGFETLTADFLGQQLEAKHLKNLSKSERKQADYWQPSTVAEVVFNSWD